MVSADNILVSADNTLLIADNTMLSVDYLNFFLFLENFTHSSRCRSYKALNNLSAVAGET
jgi:hypothetical protein